MTWFTMTTLYEIYLWSMNNTFCFDEYLLRVLASVASIDDIFAEDKVVWYQEHHTAENVIHEFE